MKRGERARESVIRIHFDLYRRGAAVALYLVTGGAGFIGSHLVEELLTKGDSVRVLDDFSTGKRENLESWLDEIDLIEGSVEDRETCERAVQGVEFVLHQAALCSVPRSVKDPVATNRTNVTGTLNLLWACKGSAFSFMVIAAVV